MMSKEITVIGGGAAGMMAAISAAEQGARVIEFINYLLFVWFNEIK